jgi:hypothetical protein
MRLHVVLAAMLAGTTLVYSAPPSGVPAPEIGKPDSSLVLPPVPRFEVPAQEPGVVDPRYLRLRGKKLLGTQVKVKGYITWIYDCISDNRQPAESREHTQQRIDADPTLCERPKFYLGSTRDVSLDKALWVVDAPRPPNKLEKERLPKEELAAWPSVPRLRVGDYVVVTGEFKLSSPHNERHSDGLVVFQAIESAKSRPLRELASSPVATPAVAPKPRAVPARPAEKPVDPKVVNISMISPSSSPTRLPGTSSSAKPSTDIGARSHRGMAITSHGTGSVARTRRRATGRRPSMRSPMLPRCAPTQPCTRCGPGSPHMRLKPTQRATSRPRS